MNEIEEAKNNFLLRYNNERTIEKAFILSVGAAFQRNKLYIDNLPSNQKVVFKNRLREFVIQKSEKYVIEQNREVYEDDIQDIKDAMNNEFRPLFSKDGFKISHAQKVLGVYLKHLWCMNMIATPPQCPIDRKILTFVHLRINWTSVNDRDTHAKKIIDHINSYIAPQNIAEWELLVFLK